ncbi:hypothetical protein GCM10022223_56180 [Kineosporia mesophila]|uniref:Uncharacterized protein n=1 Tax=Kineosporia mesophila TaxID=566012 RepID=A0ABP7AF94_9ACTN
MTCAHLEDGIAGKATAVPALHPRLDAGEARGLTVGGDGRVHIATDNDGLDDSTGETVFLSIGKASKVFGNPVILAEGTADQRAPLFMTARGRSRSPGSVRPPLPRGWRSRPGQW